MSEITCPACEGLKTLQTLDDTTNDVFTCPACHGSGMIYEDDDADDEFDCGFVVGEGCTMSGSEECDWECPYSRLIKASPYFPNCDYLGNEANDPDTLENDEPQW